MAETTLLFGIIVFIVYGIGFSYLYNHFTVITTAQMDVTDRILNHFQSNFDHESEEE